MHTQTSASIKCDCWFCNVPRSRGLFWDLRVQSFSERNSVCAAPLVSGTDRSVKSVSVKFIMYSIFSIYNVHAILYGYNVYIYYIVCSFLLGFSEFKADFGNQPTHWTHLNLCAEYITVCLCVCVFSETGQGVGGRPEASMGKHKLQTVEITRVKTGLDPGQDPTFCRGPLPQARCLHNTQSTAE